MSEREPPPLFDLPLFEDEGEASEKKPRDDGGERPERAPTVAGDPFPFDLADPPAERPAGGGRGDAAPPAGEPPGDGGQPGHEERPQPAAAVRREPRQARLAPRYAAALLDGGVLLTVAAVAIVGSFLLGIRWQLDDLPPLVLFVLVFSLLYSTVPLAFWGRTPGMALVRLVARGEDGGPLTFGQTALRWLGGLVTLLLAGLPLLLAARPLGGRSLADRLSGSRCWLEPPA